MKKSPAQYQLKYWEIPSSWRGHTAYIIGGGPSVNDVDLSLIKDKCVIGCNNAYMFGDWVDVCWFGDYKFYKWHTTEYKKWFNAYKGLIISNLDDGKINDKRVYLVHRKGQGINTEKNCVAWNSNTGASAVNLAYHFGARRIVLIGFDCKLINEKPNYHDLHLVKDSDYKWSYKKFKHFWKKIALDAKKLNVEIINTSLDSDLKHFPIKRLEDAID